MMQKYLFYTSVTDETYPCSRCKLRVRHLPVMCAPIHAAGNNMPIAQHLFHHRHVPQPICPIHPRLQNHYIPDRRPACDAPVEIMGTVCPFPGVRVGCPWHIDTVQCMVPLVCPPRTLHIRKIIALALNGRWWRWSSLVNRNTNNLIDVDHIGVGNVIVGSEPLPGSFVVNSYPS